MRAVTYNLFPAGWAACKLLAPVWRGCLLTPLNGLTLRDMPAPQLPGDDWVRVKTLMGGICGTDLAILAQKQPPNSILQAFSSTPMVLGHENVAVVEEVGPAVDRNWIGRRVCVEPTLACIQRGIEPLCHCCRQGRFGACENFAAPVPGKYNLPAGTSIGYNARTGGSMGESFVAHVSQLIPVPAEIPDELAVLTDPLACSLHSVLRADLADASRILVYGSGVLGLGVIASLRAVGFRGHIDALNRSGYVRNLALKFGADDFVQLPRQRAQRFDAIAQRTGATVQHARFGNYMLSGGYDIVFDCVGSTQALNECFKWTAARGQMVMVGTGHGGRVDLTPLWFRELRVIGAYGRQLETFDGRQINTYQLVHEFMAAGKLDLGDMLTHTFPLDQYKTALSTAMWKGPKQAIKVAFDFRNRS